VASLSEEKPSNRLNRQQNWDYDNNDVPSGTDPVKLLSLNG
jgi:hypothetical protein